MIAIRNLLVATDFSPASQTALVYGRAFARTFKARLHVLHVVEDVSPFLYPEGTGLLPYSQMETAIRRAAEQQLDAFVDASDRLELRAETVLRTGASAAKAITDYAREAAIDLLIIGATGRGAIDRLLMGSVAEKVLRHAPCPVMAVRTPEHEFVIPDALQIVETATV